MSAPCPCRQFWFPKKLSTLLNLLQAFPWFRMQGTPFVSQRRFFGPVCRQQRTAAPFFTFWSVGLLERHQLLIVLRCNFFFLFLHVWWFQILSFICDGWNSSQYIKTRRCALGKRRVAIHVFANFQHLLLSLSFNWMPSPISKVWVWRKHVLIWSAFDFIFTKITKRSSCKLESSVNKYASGSILAVITRVPFSKQSQSNPKSWLGGVSYLAARNVCDSSDRGESGGSIVAFKLHDLLSLTNIHNRY